MFGSYSEINSFLVESKKKKVTTTADFESDKVDDSCVKMNEASFEIGPGHKGAMRGKKIYDKGKGTTNPNEKDTFLRRTGPQLPLVKNTSSMQVAGYEPEGEQLDEVLGGKSGDGYIGHPRLDIKNPLHKGPRKKEETGGSGISHKLGDRQMQLDKMRNESAAWTRKAGKNKEGGLNEKGRKSYERENPGSDLKAPSKEKGNKRRASFCARMKGMKAKLTSAKTARDPDSRINKSLRAWNC